LSTNRNFVNAEVRILLAIEAVRKRIAKSNQQEKLEMNKFQTPNTLKVRKGMQINHNQSALKVRKAAVESGNHNETALKVRKALNPNHSETALKRRRALYANHNETALKVRK